MDKFEWRLKVKKSLKLEKYLQVLVSLGGRDRWVSAREVAMGVGCSEAAARKGLFRLKKSGAVKARTRYGFLVKDSGSER